MFSARCSPAHRHPFRLPSARPHIISRTAAPGAHLHVVARTAAPAPTPNPQRYSPMPLLPHRRPAAVVVNLLHHSFLVTDQLLPSLGFITSSHSISLQPSLPSFPFSSSR
ncbi:hypothetical protein ACLOJK_012462 [Asimina triloba]